MGYEYAMQSVKKFVIVGVILSLSAGTWADDFHSDAAFRSELGRIHKMIEEEKQKIAKRISAESDDKGKFHSIPTEFGQFIWKDPQSFYTAVASGSLELVVYGIARKRMQRNIVHWKHQVSLIDELRNKKFELYKSGDLTKTTTSFENLFNELALAEENLSKSLASLSKTELDQWVQSDRVSPDVKGKVMELAAKIATGAESTGDATIGKMPIELAEKAQLGAYENIRSALVQEHVVDIVKAVSRVEIPLPKKASEIFRESGGELTNLPIGGEKGIALASTPGKRSLQAQLTINAIRNVRETANRSVLNSRKLWRRASLPALLIAVPAVSIGISRYYDSLLAQENSLEQGAKLRRKSQDKYVDSMMTFLPKPLLGMVIQSWKENKSIRFHPCPVNHLENSIYNPDLDFISGIALLSILEMELKGRPLVEQPGKLPLRMDEFLKVFYEKLITFARKWNPALNRISDEKWDQVVIPDLVDLGLQNFGVSDVVSKEKIEDSKESFEFPKN